MDHTAMEDVTDVYGPNPDMMMDILDESRFLLKVTPYERVLVSPSSKDVEGHQVFCCGIPPDIFEDRIVRLFDKNRRLRNTVEVRLPMNPSTDKHYGYALITFSRREDAEKAVRELNNHEIVPSTKLTVGLSNTLDQDSIGDFVKATNFPCRGNDVHICIESSSTNYCTCIEQMVDDISNLLENIRRIEESCKEKIEKAQQLNTLRYAYHSLRMESIEANPENVRAIVDASQYAVDNMDNISLNHMLGIHELVNPADISNVGMFRTQDIYVFGIYGTRIFDETTLPPAPELVIPQVEGVIQLIKTSLSMPVTEAVIAAMQASTDFVVTHPFSDGNGRCSRILLGSILKKKGFPWVIIPETDKTRYFEAIESLKSTKNYTLIYRFLCRNIYRSMSQYYSDITN